MLLHDAAVLARYRAMERLHEVADAARGGAGHVWLLCPTPGVDAWWSGKHKHHGGNIQVVAVPDGWPLWTSGGTTWARARHHCRQS
ncbi:hypothetical protein [Micromonospora arborensis]|uniref:hypothetical protein n=1 Tax=Micromonospora arborensis TaxID=2116518 RepID=UPI00370F87A0